MRVCVDTAFSSPSTASERSIVGEMYKFARTVDTRGFDGHIVQNDIIVVCDL